MGLGATLGDLTGMLEGLFVDFEGLGRIEAEHLLEGGHSIVAEG